MLSFFGSKNKPSSAKLRDMLPATHSFVTFVVRGGGPEGRICFEGASLKTFRTTRIAGMAAGQSGVFTYTNPIGKFTFTARLLSIADDQAVFNLPDDIKTVARTAGPERRAEPRIDTTIGADWRFKPVGKIATTWSKATISDLSRVSANMTADREFKANDVIEVRMTLDAGQSITLSAAIVRSEKAGVKYKIGLAFKHVDEESSHVVTRFVNKRMTELRARGLV
jgi:hypothetical protein